MGSCTFPEPIGPFLQCEIAIRGKGPAQSQSTISTSHFPQSCCPETPTSDDLLSRLLALWTHPEQGRPTAVLSHWASLSASLRCQKARPSASNAQGPSCVWRDSGPEQPRTTHELYSWVPHSLASFMWPVAAGVEDHLHVSLERGGLEIYGR